MDNKSGGYETNWDGVRSDFKAIATLLALDAFREKNQEMYWGGVLKQFEELCSRIPDEQRSGMEETSLLLWIVCKGDPGEAARKAMEMMVSVVPPEEFQRGMEAARAHNAEFMKRYELIEAVLARSDLAPGAKQP